MKRYFYFFFALFFSQVGLSEKWECISIDDVFSEMTCTNSEGLRKTITRFSELGFGNQVVASSPRGATFEGMIFENEIMKGKALQLNGDVYEGEVKNKVFHGKGKQIQKETGSTYEGGWKNGFRSGKGKVTFSDGGTMEGDFANGLINGQIVQKSADGSFVYKGSAKDGMLHGYGEEITITKEEYSGVGIRVHEGEIRKMKIYLVQGVIEGSSAYDSQKISIGDQIISISNRRGKMVEVDKLSLEEVANLLKGREGTTVSIYIKKFGEHFPDMQEILISRNQTIKTKDPKTWEEKGINIGEEKRKEELNAMNIGFDLVTLKRRNMVVEEVSSYKGMFKDDAKNGFGRDTYADGTYYEGTFKDGLWDGFGKRTWGQGNFYLGEYKNGSCDGFGIQLNENYEIIYYGGFLGCKAHGQGGSITRTDKTTDIFSGTFENNLLNGYGEAIYANGNTYKGYWRDGKWKGQGEAYFSDIRETYIGIFNESLALVDGKATLITENFIYEGEFKDNLMHGLGKLTPINIIDADTRERGEERFVKYFKGKQVEGYIPDPSKHKEPRKVALIVGNGAYMSSRLENSVEDSRGMAKTLENLGFKVIHKVDLKKQSFIESIWEFSDQVALLGPDTTALFFYSGHAVQFDEKNYLIPVDSSMNSQKDVELQAINSDLILRALGNAFTGTKILILDACRNNPFISKTKSSSGGLAPMSSSVGTFIGYATGPGEVALDGTSQGYSVYTGNLINAINTPGLTIEQVFKRTRSKVAEQTNNQQVPWDYSSLIGEFYFNKE